MSRATIRHVFPQQSPGELADDLGLLASALDLLDLEATDLPPPRAEQTRNRLVRSIRSYLIPRLMNPDGPLTVVFAGPTGSGKSTLVNSLSGLEVSKTGPIRPTTKDPVVLTSADHRSGFQRISEVECEVVVGRAPILQDLALVDTPDIDSTSRDHRITAEILIDNADVIVFVTSALRYADRVPWEVLRRAISRGAPIIQVLNRVSPQSAGSIVDFRSRLASEGIGSDVVRVPEHHLSPDAQAIPATAVGELRRRLTGIANRIDRSRRESFSRVLASTVDEIVELADALDIRIQGTELRRQHVRQRFGNGARQLDLRGVWGDLAPDEPPEGIWRLLLWRWSNRLSEDRWAIVKSTIRQRLVAVVEGDIRRLGAMTLNRSPLSSATVARIRELARGAVDAWLAQLEELARAQGSRPWRLAAASLGHSATEGRRSAAFDVLFDGESALVRSYRGLASRLEVVYGQIGDLIAASVAGEPIDAVHTERLREVAAAVVVRSHFADA